MTWQAIETAPRDGTWIMLGWFLEAGGGGPPGVAYWSGFKNTWVSEGRAMNSSGYFSPTHWMPLPDPPNEKARPR